MKNRTTFKRLVLWMIAEQNEHEHESNKIEKKNVAHYGFIDRDGIVYLDNIEPKDPVNGSVER